MTPGRFFLEKDLSGVFLFHSKESTPFGFYRIGERIQEYLACMKFPIDKYGKIVYFDNQNILKSK